MKKSLLIPLGLFLALAVFLGIGLKLDPREVPSPLVGNNTVLPFAKTPNP
jgi:cytochrome c biogenesis protein CcmG, thiol:disulfide interchange protein DsbE